MSPRGNDPRQWAAREIRAVARKPEDIRPIPSRTRVKGPALGDVDLPILLKLFIPVAADAVAGDDLDCQVNLPKGSPVVQPVGMVPNHEEQVGLPGRANGQEPHLERHQDNRPQVNAPRVP